MVPSVMVRLFLLFKRFFFFCYFKQLSFLSTDIDECGLGLDDCHTNATCNNTVGSYICICDTGFIGDGRVCTGTMSLYFQVMSY